MPKAASMPCSSGRHIRRQARLVIIVVGCLAWALAGATSHGEPGGPQPLPPPRPRESTIPPPIDLELALGGEARYVVAERVLGQLEGAPRSAAAGDLDRDGDVDQSDFGHLQVCLSGPGVPQEDDACTGALLDGDDDVDSGDVIIFRGCLSGTNVPGDPGCAD